MTTLTRWTPFTPAVPSLLRDFDELFRFSQPATPHTLTPAADVVETANAYELTLDLPGMKPAEIDVKLERDTLTITAERKEEQRADGKGFLRQERAWGVYARSFVFGEDVVGTSPEAKYEHGVLTVTLPKREETKPKTVQVKVAG